MAVDKPTELAMVLVIDDEEIIRQTVASILQQLDISTELAANGKEGLERAAEGNYEVALVDLNMPGLSGMETVRRLKEVAPDTEIIIFTGHPSLETSIAAIQESVFDYLCKPVQMGQLARTIKRARERRRLVLENRDLLDQLEGERNSLQKQVVSAKRVLERQIHESASFVGESEHIKEVRRFIAEVAHDDITVLVRGESGTGKDVVARLIHNFSGRSDTGDFVKINCPAIPETLLESELFGHEAGAFTGAERRKPGRFELAARGTVFLDEIGEIPPGLQVKLLQVIEHKQFTRLGGSETIRVDARIVAATNASLEELIANGQFRADLYYRLNEYSIDMLPLRQRAEDIPVLARHFLAHYGAKHGRPNLELSPESLALIMQHTWPGNVRELETVMRRYALGGREDTIRGSLAQLISANGTPPPLEGWPLSGPPGADMLREAEIQALMSALSETRWNQRKAAKLLGISYSSLRRRIAKHNLKERRA